MPGVSRGIVEHGQDLVDVFVSGRELLARVRSALEGSADWLERLATLAERERLLPGELEQRNLFEQVEDVFAETGEEHPLLIMLDDLQWSDNASINLLFHLGRRLLGRRILIVGAYRPEEIALGRSGEPHPLKPVLAELKRQFGEAWIDLSIMQDKESRSFVESYLESTPNRLSEDFRTALYMHTRGHPLFTVELLRDLQERGDLILDDDGQLVEGRELDWSVLPARVEGVIEERIGRLEETLQETLRIASVEGENFTAQVVARVQKVSEMLLFGRLNRELEKHHRLVRSQGETKVREHILSQYSFSHALFQQFLYNGLSSGERRLMHGEVARILEELYAGETGSIAVHLAHHYTHAEQLDQAIHYLLLAGDRARMLTAHEETIDQYNRALGFMKERGAHELAAKTLMKLGLAYHNVFNYQMAQQMFDEGFAMRQYGIGTSKITASIGSQTFRWVLYEPRTLDPTLGYDFFYIGSIFSGLVERGTVREIMPDVAQSWEISEDGRRYIFNLRNDVTWSDGKQVTAADFEYAWKRTLNPSTGAPVGLASLLYEIKSAESYHLGDISDPDQVGIRAIDDLTLEVELERPASYFLHLLTTLCPVPQHVVETYRAKWTDLENIVTNGPFQLESYQPGESLVLVRDPTFHGHFPGNVEKYELIISVPATSPESLEMYEADLLDMVILSEETFHARNKHAEEYLPDTWPGIYYIGFDTRHPPFDDQMVRCAFVMAVDKERLSSEALQGFYYPANGGFVPPGMPGHSPEIGLSYDPVLARELLTQAGYPNGLGIPNLILMYHPDESSLLEGLRLQWLENLNVDVAIEIDNGDGRFENEENLVNFFLASRIQRYPDPDNFLRVCIQSLLPHWRNTVYDQLLDEARRTLHQEERIRLYQAADKILIEDATVMPILYYRFHSLVKPWFINPDWKHGPLPFKAAIIEPH
jgi:oligopeptide transport system substrate-binding protein